MGVSGEDKGVREGFPDCQKGMAGGADAPRGHVGMSIEYRGIQMTPEGEPRGFGCYLNRPRYSCPLYPAEGAYAPSASLSFCAACSQAAVAAWRALIVSRSWALSCGTFAPPA
jgi:hypothetical protein